MSLRAKKEQRAFPIGYNIYLFKVVFCADDIYSIELIVSLILFRAYRQVVLFALYNVLYSLLLSIFIFMHIICKLSQMFSDSQSHSFIV